MLQRRKTMTDSAKPFAAKKFLEINGRRMAYIDEGEGAPIVFAHGNPTSSYLWRNVMPACRGLGRLIACDMIGMGDSEKLPDSGPDRYTYAEQRNFLFALWKKLGVDTGIHFVQEDSPEQIGQALAAFVRSLRSLWHSKRITGETPLIAGGLR